MSRDPGHDACAELTRRYGTTYYWGALLLPVEQRHDVYAVYALCRLADDLVDEADLIHPSVPDAIRALPDPAARLAGFADFFARSLEAGSDDPVMSRIVDTVRRRAIPLDCFDRFFAAMALDLTRTTWSSWEELRDGYMEGSAAVIGEMMLPVLEPARDARTPARSLGLAFQLTNFIRDVGEDLDRGRVYLPQDELVAHGADPWLRRVTPEWRSFLAAQIARNRTLYDEALPGLAVLPDRSRRCVGTAHQLYARILDRIESADYDVFSDRVRVPTWRKMAAMASAAVAGPPRLRPLREVSSAA